MFGSDSGANKFKKTYFNGFVDISGGDIILRDGSIVMSDTSVFKKNNFNLIIPTLTSNDYLVTSSLAALNYQTISGMNYYLTKALATSIYQPISLMSNYLTLSGVTKTTVGLSNVDNTSDINKPISTATQTVLDLKANLDNPTFPSRVSIEESIKLIKKASSGSVNAILWAEENQFSLRGYINCDPIGNKKMNFNVLTSVLTDGFEFSGGSVNITSGVLKLNGSSINTIYQSISGMINYLTTATANSTYQPISLMSSYLTTATASSTYQTIADMSSYLTSATASSTYQTIADMSSYLTTATASSTYQPVFLMSSYLTTATANSTYQPISLMSSYLTTSLASSTYQPISNYAFGYNTSTQNIPNNTATLINFPSSNSSGITVASNSFTITVSSTYEIAMYGSIIPVSGGLQATFVFRKNGSTMSLSTKNVVFNGPSNKVSFDLVSVQSLLAGDVITAYVTYNILTGGTTANIIPSGSGYGVAMIIKNI